MFKHYIKDGFTMTAPMKNEMDITCCRIKVKTCKATAVTNFTQEQGIIKVLQFMNIPLPY